MWTKKVQIYFEENVFERNGFLVNSIKKKQKQNKKKLIIFMVYAIRAVGKYLYRKFP